MELEELKQKWNKLDERLSKSEVYNERMLKEPLRGQNQTHYERLRRVGTVHGGLSPHPPFTLQCDERHSDTASRPDQLQARLCL